MTDVEKVLWQRLKAKQLDGHKLRRQEQVGRFTANFVCFEKGIAIEADAGQHGATLAFGAVISVVSQSKELSRAPGIYQLYCKFTLYFCNTVDINTA